MVSVDYRRWLHQTHHICCLPDPRIFPDLSAALLPEAFSHPMGDVSSCCLHLVLVSYLLFLPARLKTSQKWAFILGESLLSLPRFDEKCTGLFFSFLAAKVDCNIWYSSALPSFPLIVFLLFCVRKMNSPVAHTVQLYLYSHLNEQWTTYQWKMYAVV